jgi:hypothetical protein
MSKCYLSSGLALVLTVAVWADEPKQPATIPNLPIITMDFGPLPDFKNLLPPDIGKTPAMALHKVLRGTVNGIEVTAAAPQLFGGGLAAGRCSAFINPKQAGAEPIRVVTSEHRLQTVFESASARGVEVEVMYVEQNGENWLTLLRILDREPLAKK